MTNKNLVLTTTNLPMYSIQTFFKSYIIVAGGGGSSKTGITNGFEIYKISKSGKSVTMTKVINQDSGPHVIMNSYTFTHGNSVYIAANENEKCRQYLAQVIIEPTFNNGKASKELKFKISTESSLVTDFHDEESLQRIVKVNLTGNLMVTGGADGCIRLWEFPLKETSDMKPLKEYKGHTKEIDDIDISANSMFIVSVAKDGNAFHWNTSNNAKTSLVNPNNIKQTFKRCKFGIINKQLFNIYTIANRANQKSYLQRWSNENKLLYEFQYSEPTSALAVREDGFYIAVGTMFSGTVSIHEALNLKMIYNVKQAHAMFVTGLEFLSKDLMPEMNASVLSISVDNRICLHNVPIKPLKPFWKMLLIMHFILLVIYITIFNLGIN